MQVQSEGPVKIGRGTIEAAWKRRQPGVRLVIRDLACPGLSLVVNPRGMVWRLDWRPRGFDPITDRRWPSQSITLGTPEQHAPDAARDEAGRLKGHAKAGADPGAERQQKIAAASRKRASTASRLIEEYEQQLPERPRLRGTGVVGADYAAAEVAHVRAAVKAMSAEDRPVADINVADLTRMLTARAKQPATGRKHFGALSRFLDWCGEHGHVEINPCLRLPKGRRPRAVRSRTVCPSLADLAAIWFAAADLTEAERDWVRWLIAVPCRLREGTCLDWSHVDFRNSWIELPAAMMKNEDTHRIHVHPVAASLLRARYLAAGEPTTGLVFPSARSGRPIESFSKTKARLIAASGVDGWAFHDLRRSFASACAEHGVAEPVADAVLSHRQSATRAGVLGVYQRSIRWPEQVAAMNTWGAALQAALIGFASRD